MTATSLRPPSLGPSSLSTSAATGMLVLACLAAAPAAHAADAASSTAITVTDKGCNPETLTVSAGKNTFTIRNASARALEWEILQGVDVIAERENIVPGFVQPLSATLDAGDYQMTCGLLSNPKGILHVAAGGAAKPAPPSPMDLVGPIAAYKVYASGEVDTLVTATRAFTTAIKAGNGDLARTLYAPARQHYERVEPIAELFNDLDNSIDARADDFEKKEADPNWTGFHRIEKSLFADKTTDGLGPIADKLQSDVEDLQKRLVNLVVTPKAMVGGAADLIEEVAATKITGEEDRYSHTDLWDFQANVDGAQKIVALLRPLIQRQNPDLLARLDANFAKVDAVLGKYRVGDGFKDYAAVSDADRTAFKGPVTELAEDLSQLRGTLGVE